MFLPPAFQQPVPKPETGIASLLQKHDAVLSLKRRAIGALYGQGTVEVESLEASDGTDTRKGVSLRVAGPGRNDPEGRALLETTELPGLLAVLDRFQTEALKLASGGGETTFTYTSTGGFSMELARGREGVAFILRAGRGGAVFTMSQIAALKDLLTKARAASGQ